MWDQLTIGYLAGLIDGEGHFRMQKNQAYMSLEVTDKEIVDLAFSRSKIGKLYGPYLRKDGRKPMWRWRVSNDKELVRLMLAIYPLVCPRRQEQMIPLIDWISSRVPKLKECANSKCNESFLPTGKSGNQINRLYCSQHCNYGAWYYRQKKVVV